MNIFDRIQPLISNPIDAAAYRSKKIAAILGEKPSVSAKSPSLWNPVFEQMKLGAVFLAFDVSNQNLKSVVSALKESDEFLGGSVTFPHKISIMSELDDLDPIAKRIGAVNAIERRPDGKLIGHNTDGKGAVDALLKKLPNTKEAALSSLRGKRVLLIGAGGAARAVAFYVQNELGEDGKMWIANRSRESAEKLVRDLNQFSPKAEALALEAVPDLLAGVEILINASSCGQGGTPSEPFSPLAPQPSFKGNSVKELLQNSLEAVVENHRLSLVRCIRSPEQVLFYDIIHTPTESTLLRHARWTGHRTLNGRGMNIAQAADAFCNRVCRSWLQKSGLQSEDLYDRVFSIMSSVW